MHAPPFDPEKPFFSLVMNFAVQMMGFKEVMEMANILTLRKMTRQIFDASHLEGAPIELVVSPGLTLDGYDLAYPFKQRLRELLPQTPNLPLDRLLTHTSPFEIVGSRSLKCRSQMDGVEFSAEQLAGVYLARADRQVRALAVSAGSLLIAAYEVTKNMSDRGPVWEFFRHCRNAAAHGGRFNFTAQEPSRPAAWKTIHVDSTLQGTPLFDLPGVQGLLGLGDPILLLWDIERL
jgi:hypothetical protein